MRNTERLFFIFNGDYELQRVALPPLEAERHWYRSIDTSLAAGEDFVETGHEVEIEPVDHYLANPRSTVLLLAQRR